MKKKLTMLLTILLICIAFGSMPVIASVRISNSSISMVKGDKKQLKVNGTKSKVKWTSGNKKIAVVSSNGIVTAKKNGQTTIYAYVNGTKYSCKVTVYNVGEYFNKKCKEKIGDKIISLRFTELYISRQANINISYDYIHLKITNPNYMNEPVLFPYWIYIDHKKVDIINVQYSHEISLIISGIQLKKGNHIIEVVQYEDDNPKKKVTLYKKLFYNVVLT